MATFQHIRLELAREPGHPGGDPRDGWDIVAPLDGEGRIDLGACLAAPEQCHVRRFQQEVTVATGRLRHTLGDRWRLDLDGHDDLDGTGFRLGEERFTLGEYVSIVTGDGLTHTYRVQRLVPVDSDPVQADTR